MKKLLYIFLLLPATQVFAQVPEDVIRYSFFPQNGTARNIATGGVMGSLGGDLTANFVNPAGLGFFKTREVVITPAFFFNNQNARFRDANTKEKNSNFGIGPMGVIFGQPNRYNPRNSSAFSIALTQTANFNNTVRYKGLNNFSSFSESFAEEFSKSGYSINDVLNTMSPLPYTSALGLQTYLIDTVTIGGQTIVRGAPENILDAGQALQQEMLRETSGGLYELAISGAYNKDDKWYFGGSIGIPIVNYKSNTTFTESDTSSNTSNGFKSFTYNDEFRTIGAGVNLKVGIIYRPEEHLRFGLAIHTPSVFLQRDEHTASLTTNLETASGQPESFSASSLLFTNNQQGVSKYMQSTAWRALLSGSYVFREIEDVRKQKGFISADIEYVNHRGGRFSSDNEEVTDDEKAYYKALNNVVKDLYKGAFNFRVGGELKFNVIMARLGFGYYGNPYKEADFKANRMVLSGGLGYRHKGMFIDLTYAHHINKDADYPYRLADRPNNFTYATTKQNLGNVVATVGWKF